MIRHYNGNVHKNPWFTFVCAFVKLFWLAGNCNAFRQEVISNGQMADHHHCEGKKFSFPYRLDSKLVVSCRALQHGPSPDARRRLERRFAARGHRQCQPRLSFATTAGPNQCFSAQDSGSFISFAVERLIKNGSKKIFRIFPFKWPKSTIRAFQCACG